MNWEIMLKAPTPIKVLAAIFKEAPELWYRAKKIHPTYWDLLNSYMLMLIKAHPKKDIEWFVKKARKWVENERDINKAFDFKKLPGVNINAWGMLLETLNPMTVKVAYNKLLEEGVKFSRYRDTQSFLDKTRENGRQVARNVIGKGAREQRDRMETIAANPDALSVLKEKIPEDASALQDLFKGVSSVKHSSNFETVNITPKIAYDYIININQKKKLHGANIRELHLPELNKLVHKTKNKKWLNSMLKSVLLDIGESMTELFREVYEDKALRKDLLLRDYMNEAWEEYDTSTIDEEKLNESDWRKDFKRNLVSDRPNQEKVEWKEFLESRRNAIRTIKSGVPPLFVKFMGTLAHALQANAESGNLKELSDAFLEVYSQEEANTFSSEYLKQEGGGFGYMKRVQSPRIREQGDLKSQYAGRTLPESPANYVSIVKEIHDMLLGDLEKEGDEDLDDLWQDMAGTSEGRVQTKEYHLAGVSDKDAKTEFDNVISKFANDLEKAIAIEVYDAYVNGEELNLKPLILK